MAGAADCIFCRIVEGSAPSFKLAEDELSCAFLDIFPVAPGHTLVITREHAENIFEASPEALAAVARSAHRVAHAIRGVLEPEGLGVHQLNGAAAGQTVFHYHTHLIPRHAGAPFALHSRVRGRDSELAAMAGRLREELARGDAAGAGSGSS